MTALHRAYTVQVPEGERIVNEFGDVPLGEESAGVLALRHELEQAAIAADLAYLRDQEARMKRRLNETAELERAYVARRGWSL